MVHTQSLRVHGTADAGERGTAEAGNEKLEVPKWPWLGDQKRPDQARTGQKRIKKVQCRWVAATVPVAHLWSNMQVQAATATAGDIPSWFLRRPCPKEIREDLIPANQCRAPAAETRMRSRCTVPVCHTEPPAQASRLAGSGPLNLTVLWREANRSLFPVAGRSVGGNVYVAIDSNLRSKATVAGDRPERWWQRDWRCYCYASSRMYLKHCTIAGEVASAWRNTEGPSHSWVPRSRHRHPAPATAHC